jgi:hypothetical protein
MGRDIQAWGGRGAMSVEVLQEGAEVVRSDRIGTVDCVLTSPPYFDLEQYSTEATQSHVKFPTFPLWVNGFLAPMFRTAYDCLRPGGFCIINITSTPTDVVLANLEAEALRVARMTVFELAYSIAMVKPPPSGFDSDCGPGTGGRTTYQPPKRIGAARAPEQIFVFCKPVAAAPYS